MEGLRRAWPLLFSLPLIVALVAASLLSGCEGSRPSAQEERQHAWLHRASERHGHPQGKYPQTDGDPECDARLQETFGQNPAAP